MARLFKNQEDLLSEFGQFLPDANSSVVSGDSDILLNMNVYILLNSFLFSFSEMFFDTKLLLDFCFSFFFVFAVLSLIVICTSPCSCWGRVLQTEQSQSVMIMVPQ